MPKQPWSFSNFLLFLAAAFLLFCWSGCDEIPIAELTADPTVISPGQASTLTWTSQNAVRAELDQGIGEVPPTGSLVVTPSATTLYTLTVTGEQGATFQASTEVTVTPYSDTVINYEYDELGRIKKIHRIPG